MPQKYSPLLEKASSSSSLPRRDQFTCSFAPPRASFDRQALRLSSNIGGEEQWHYIPELAVSQEQEEALRDAVQKQCPGGQNPLVIPVEWVVDVADESDTWFIATAYSFNDSTSTLHVMVPDCDNPDWEGDIPINPRLAKLAKCPFCRVTPSLSPTIHANPNAGSFICWSAVTRILERYLNH
jgi:hypothetical protein